MYPYKLPILSFTFDAFEPIIDAKTMEIHYSKHHAAYVDNLNKLLENHKDLHNLSIEDLLNQIDRVPEDIRQGVINNAGGHANHTHFWSILKKDGINQPMGEIKECINEEFGNFDELKSQIIAAGLKRFGSGWVWLVMKDARIQIISTPNQDSPLMHGAIPLFGIDLWEHAYYLQYQNRRAEYLENIFAILNWEEININFLRA